NAVVGPDGSLVNLEEFTPYGDTSFGSFAKKRYRFTAKERDEETGFTYHVARDYAPWLGRWSSCDPIAPQSGQNPYCYSHNDPIRFTDPRGTDPNDPTAPLTLGGVGVTVGSNGVKVGPLNPMAASPCDELNPQCNGKAPNPSTEKSNDAGVMERLKTYHPGP